MVSLRLAHDNDFDLFYKIKSEDVNIYWTGYLNKPVYEKLKVTFINWIANSNRAESRKVYIVLFGKERVGYLYMDPCQQDEVELSIAVLSEFAGRQIGQNAYAEAINILRKQGARCAFAYVREDNHRAEKILLANGFVKELNYRTAFIQSLNREIRQFRYSLCLVCEEKFNGG